MYATEYAILGGDKRQMKTTASSLRVIREGLSVHMIDTAAKVLEVSKSELVALIGLSLRSLQRKTGMDHLTSQQSEQMLAIISTLTNAEKYFDDKDTVLVWLKTPHVIFGKHKPIDYLDTMTGIQFVNNTLNRMKHGVTA